MRSPKRDSDKSNSPMEIAMEVEAIKGLQFQQIATQSHPTIHMEVRLEADMGVDLEPDLN